MAAQCRRGNNSDGVEKCSVGRTSSDLNVEIRLIEAVEEHDAACARFFEPRAQIGQAGERLRELDGHRNLDRFANALQPVRAAAARARPRSGCGRWPAHRCSARWRCAPACSISLAKRTQPPLVAPFRLAMMGMLDRLAGAPQMLEIPFVRHAVVVEFGQVIERLGERIRCRATDLRRACATPAPTAPQRAR